ncbi:gamma carbonic anhydrase family protein [uncultured Pseudokineococcus sp.]|uniref:gamma carbonic anhydrase family protein n=1 Tax=uncultured Pseudokineococcus sp. TaxID=1642928 RepID=UPI002604C518|nr:gamma carbonic anhydrase family protein [uncultured Pseudokineococcus sp.]
MTAPLLLGLEGVAPVVEPGAWVAPGAVLVGDVHVAAGASVWYGCVLRADGAAIRVGARSNLQDGCVVHADEHGGVDVGEDVTVGHRAVLHGCTVGDGALVGMASVVLTGAVVGPEALVAAGAVVREGAAVPRRALVAGVPGRVLRELDEEELARVRAGAGGYVRLAERHRAADVVGDGW